MTAVRDFLPEIAAVASPSAARRAGLRVGDKVVKVNGVTPRDIIEWYDLVDNDRVVMSIIREGSPLSVVAERVEGEPFGAEVSSAVFDRVQTCDNHCEFCFIYQLPKGMRRSLYLKDDDYRLSFLYGNFTTLTRFTEADFERVVAQRLSPLYVSIHSTDPDLRAEMLRNPRGGFSLRWAHELMRHGIEVRGQIVLCPGVNDSSQLDRTILDALDAMSSLSGIAVVPVGLSKHNTESRMRVHTDIESRKVVRQVERWQRVAMEVLGRRFVFLADEFYLQAGLPIPSAENYEEFDMLEDGIGLARRFLDSFNGRQGTRDDAPQPAAAPGFFAAMSAREQQSATNPTDYVSNPAADTALRSRPAQKIALRPRISKFSHVCVLTGECARPMIEESVRSLGSDRIRVAAIANSHFGGNTSVTGLLTGADISRFLEQDRSSSMFENLYLLPDVCLNGGRFLDGTTIDEIRAHFPVHVLPADGGMLRQFLDDFLASADLAAAT